MDDLLKIIGNFPSGISPAEIERHLKDVSRATINRRLREGVLAGTIVSQGRGPNTRYFSADPDSAVRAYLGRPYNERLLAKYQEERLSTHPTLSEQSLSILRESTGRALGKRDLTQFLVDFSCASSVLEGGTYSLMDTLALIEYGQRNKDKPLSDAYLVLNHKEAFEYLYDNPRLDSIFRVQDLLTNDHEIAELENARHFLPKQYRGVVREYQDVTIALSAYMPPFRPGTGYIKEMLNMILENAKKIENPIQACFYLLTRIPYLQPFQDGNKRTARAMCNIPLMQAGLPPISFVDFDRQEYITSMLAFYEVGSLSLAERCFVDAYQKSKERVRNVRDFDDSEIRQKAEKKFVRVYSAETGYGKYNGKVELENALFVVQHVGQHEGVIHHKGNLETIPKIGEYVDVVYQKGYAKVTIMEQNRDTKAVER